MKHSEISNINGNGCFTSKNRTVGKVCAVLSHNVMTTLIHYDPRGEGLPDQVRVLRLWGLCARGVVPGS